jgi:uncharacterized membrane protein
MAISFVALLGALVALYLTLYKVGVIGTLTCQVGSCETVNLSRWATFLGLPVAAWGLVAYVLLFALALLGVQDAYVDSQRLSWAMVSISGWSVLFSGWLTYLELFVIHAICMWCVTSALLMTVIFVLSLVDLRRVKQAWEAEGERSEGDREHLSTAGATKSL